MKSKIFYFFQICHIKFLNYFLYFNKFSYVSFIGRIILNLYLMFSRLVLKVFGLYDKEGQWVFVTLNLYLILQIANKGLWFNLYNQAGVEGCGDGAQLRVRVARARTPGFFFLLGERRGNFYKKWGLGKEIYPI